MSEKSTTTEMEYEIIGSRDPTLAHVWWDGKKIASDDNGYLASLDARPIGILTVNSGLEYLKKLPQLYRSGYIRVKRVDK